MNDIGRRNQKNICLVNVFFRQIKSFIRFRLAFVFGPQTIKSIDLTKIDQIKGLKPKTKG